MSDAVRVAAKDSSKKNSPIAGPVEEESTVMLDSASSVCFWNGQEFKDGDVVDSSGVKYECSYGQWVKQE